MHRGNTIQNSCRKSIFLKFQLQESSNHSLTCFISPKFIFFQSTVKQIIMYIYLLPALINIQYMKLKHSTKHFSAAKYTGNKLRYFLVLWIAFTMTFSVGF